MLIVRLWFAVSLTALAVLFLYAYAPIVLVFLAVTVGMGLVSFAIVWLAKRLDQRPPTDADDQP